MEVHNGTGEEYSSHDGHGVLPGHRLDDDGVCTHRFSAGPLRIDRRHLDRRDPRRRPQGHGDRDQHVDGTVAAGDDGRVRVLFHSQPAGGFKTYTQKGVNVPINVATRVDATIQLGALSEQVTVEANAAVLQTSKSDVSVSLDPRAIENLPLSGYRNFQTLINLVPGATPARFQNAVTDTPGRALTSNVNGQELDGSADILVTMPHHAVYVPPVESIQEVSISTNSFDAEQGMTGGAAVTVITKSGTNVIRGSAFAMHDNSKLRAFLWDENRVGLKEKPKGSRNIDGGSIGGPIKKNKLFFFTDWEGTFERVNRIRLSSVPTADFRGGNFGRMLGAPILSAGGSPIL
jgi:hypothetical protein